MAPMSFHDFAGSTVVHTIGASSLAGAIVLGPRLGRVFKRDGGTPMKPHDLTVGATGGLLLWFGWYGFKYGAPTPTGADTSTVLTGLFYGGGLSVLKAQVIGSFSITIATFILSMALRYGVQLAFRLRVPTEGEIEGLDLHERGFLAYPEYVVTGNDGSRRASTMFRSAGERCRGQANPRRWHKPNSFPTRAAGSLRSQPLLFWGRTRLESGIGAMDYPARWTR